MTPGVLRPIAAHGRSSSPTGPTRLPSVLAGADAAAARRRAHRESAVGRVRAREERVRRRRHPRSRFAWRSPGEDERAITITDDGEGMSLDTISVRLAGSRSRSPAETTSGGSAVPDRHNRLPLGEKGGRALRRPQAGRPDQADDPRCGIRESASSTSTGVNSPPSASWTKPW